MSDGARAQLLLQSWFSPAFPIGGFAFSHGLEWAHEAGTVGGRAELTDWLADLLRHGSGRNDAILVAQAQAAFTQGETRLMQEIADLAAALQPSRERWLEATVQGQAFLTLVRAAWPHPALDMLAPLDLAQLTLPVAVGFAGAAHEIPAGALRLAFLAGFVANLVSAAVRLGILGQTDGQRVIAALHPLIAETAAQTAHARLDDLGSAAFAAELASLQHETLYSRLFRS